MKRPPTSKKPGSRAAEPLPAPVGLREGNKRDKLARIQRAAVELFRKHGFDATTTRQIAQHAGIAAGTLFLYVKTKEELVFLIFREEIEQVLAERFASVPDAPVVDQLCHVFEGFLRFYARDVELSRVLLREIFFLRGEMAAPNMNLTMDFLARLSHILAQAQSRGELTDDAPAPTVAMHCFALYILGVISVVQAGPDAVEGTVATLREAIELHLRGLRPQPRPHH